MDIDQIKGLSEVFDAYDGFVFDLWGVIHDGSRTFPGVINTLNKLKSENKKVVFLSNSPQRAADNAVHLETLGITTDMYEGIVTSGEISYREVGLRLKEKWGKHYLCLGSGRYNDFLKDQGAEPVFDEEDADFILNGGVLWFKEEIDRYLPLFERCVSKKVPMLCTNPDKTVYVGSSLIICSGALAEKYEEMGGTVTYFGKPYKEVYEECLRFINSSKILAIGDNMETDVKGASEFGFDSLLIKGGVHRNELKDKSLEDFLFSYNYSPKYVLEEVIW